MPRWIVEPSPRDAARAAAQLLARAAHDAVSARGRFTVAVSGGSTPLMMLAELAGLDVPWERVSVFQVDERVAPDGDPARNLTPLRANLPAAADLRPMPVTADDLEAAAARYAQQLPATFDLVHLGVGDDGHTASLVPADPVLGIVDRDVALTQPYRGHRRMTLTYPVLDRAAHVMYLATGADKRWALDLLRAGDPAIPASRVRAGDQVVVCDEAAIGSAPRG